MPDLTVHSFLYCTSVENFKVNVGNYVVSHGYDPSGYYTYDWRCTCQGFKYRGKCKHIDLVKANKHEGPSYCGWDQFTDGGDAILSEDGRRCPECNALVSARLVGV